MSNLLKLPIKEMKLKLRMDLETLISEDWERVLAHLPSVQSGKISVDASTRRNCLNAVTMHTKAGTFVMNFMKSRCLLLGELYSAFEAIDLEKGLYLLEKPETKISILQAPTWLISVQSGMPIELVCHAECFPKPTYEYLINGVSKCKNKVFRINSAR